MLKEAFCQIQVKKLVEIRGNALGMSYFLFNFFWHVPRQQNTPLLPGALGVSQLT